jgi:hypothetical protein
MSSAPAEMPTRGTPPSPGAGSGFQKKYGPLPAWGWILLAAAGAGAYLWWRNRSGATAASQGASSSDNEADAGEDVQGQLATIQTEIQDLEGEDSTGGTTGKKDKKPTRHVSTGKESFNQIAKARDTSVAHLVSASEGAGEDKANLDKLHKWASHPGTRRKGIVYYTG